MSRNGLLLPLLLVAGGCVQPGTTTSEPRSEAPPPITDGRSLVDAMQRKYVGAWYRTLTFTQRNTLYAANGRETQSDWRQRITVPGKLRIDYLPLTSKSGLVYDGARIHTLDNGRVVNTQPGINAPLLLTADVYVRPPDETVRLLDSLGFDLKSARRDTWLESPVWV